MSMMKDEAIREKNREDIFKPWYTVSDCAKCRDFVRAEIAQEITFKIFSEIEDIRKCLLCNYSDTCPFKPFSDFCKKYQDLKAFWQKWEGKK